MGNESFHRCRPTSARTIHGSFTNQRRAAAHDAQKSGPKLEPVVHREVQLGRAHLGHIPRHAGSGEQGRDLRHARCADR